jgi:hypothetical protein
VRREAYFYHEGLEGENMNPDVKPGRKRIMKKRKRKEKKKQKREKQKFKTKT